MTVLQVPGEGSGGARLGAVTPHEQSPRGGDMFHRAQMTPTVDPPLESGPRRRTVAMVDRARDRFRPVLARLATLYLGDQQPRRSYLSSGPYHPERVFRTWR